jgi:phosphonate transport system permease protein
MVENPLSPRLPDDWRLRQPFSIKFVLALLAVAICLAISARRTEIDKACFQTLEGIAYAFGLTDHAEVASGWQNLMASAFPLTLSEEREVTRIENFDRNNLPAFSHLVSKPEREYDLDSGEWVVSGEKEYLVEPFGYLMHVLWKMVETLEMAVWGTLLALVLSIPLAWFSTRGYTWNRGTYFLARATCSFTRALPELIVAIFCVLLFGFGTIPGVLALGFHCAGFFGKFFADDIENADPGPQDALRSTGAGRIKVFRYAVLPQVTPQFVAYVQYIMERNVRTATVLGIVGAGGIGLELKGRLDLSDYSHVSTTLVVIFITVFLLEQLTQSVRGKLINA